MSGWTWEDFVGTSLEYSQRNVLCVRTYRFLDNMDPGSCLRQCQLLRTSALALVHRRF